VLVESYDIQAIAYCELKNIGVALWKRLKFINTGTSQLTQHCFGRKEMRWRGILIRMCLHITWYMTKSLNLFGNSHHQCDTNFVFSPYFGNKHIGRISFTKHVSWSKFLKRILRVSTMLYHDNLRIKHTRASPAIKLK
jgi:hypothetical protein